MPAIFISYRREDSAGYAGRLFDRLKEEFGHSHVFWDVSGSIEPGEPFDRAIERAIDSCDALLAVIGQRWLTSTDEAGKRRIEDPDDYVHLELSMALRREVRVIPVLVQRAAMPHIEDLPQDLRPLALHQAVELSDNRWDFDVSQLIDTLRKALDRPKAWRVPRWTKAAAVSVLLIAGGFGIWKVWPDGHMPPPPPPIESKIQIPAFFLGKWSGEARGFILEQLPASAYRLTLTIRSTKSFVTGPTVAGNCSAVLVPTDKNDTSITFREESIEGPCTAGRVKISKIDDSSINYESDVGFVVVRGTLHKIE